MSMDAPGYEQLAAVLQAAYDQAAAGKGAERHADGKPFHEQPMQTGSDMLGTDAGLAFQAIKKIREGSTFAEFDRFERELLGAINYIAGMIIWRRRQLPRMTEAHPSAEQSLGRMKRASSIGGVRQEGETIIVSTPEQRAAIYAALNAVPNADGGTVSIRFGAQPFCAECEYPDDGTGTHYATCSKLTAPKEFVEQVEATFDELEIHEPAQDIVMHVNHKPFDWDADDPNPEPPSMSNEEAAQGLQDIIDSEDVRIDNIARNGNDGEHYDDPFAGAPEWAKYKAQDACGAWWFYECQPTAEDGCYALDRGICKSGPRDGPNPNWRDTLIERTSG